MILFWAEQKGDFAASEVNAKEWIRGMCGRPVFILQGGRDDHIPPESGQWLYDAACEPKEYWFEPEAAHIGLDDPDVVTADVYETRVASFFDQYLLGD